MNLTYTNSNNKIVYKTQQKRNSTCVWCRLHRFRIIRGGGVKRVLSELVRISGNLSYIQLC